MGRMPRIHIEGGLYFITSRGGQGSQLFRDDADYAQYLELLSRYKKEHNFKLFSYILMPNYLHLLIEPATGTTISDIMHVINSTYTKYFNARYKRRGHVFQGRYKATLAEKASSLNELTRYMHLVPIMAKATGRPEDYRWSSYRTYTGMEKDALGIGADLKEVLNAFSPDPAEQARLYKEYVESALPRKLEELNKRLQTSWILGSKVFADEVKKRLKEDVKKEEEEKEKAWVEGRPHKVFLVAGSVTILILIIFTFFLYRTKLGFESKLEKKESEFIERLGEEKRKLRQDLDEKYRADTVSYQAMQKRLELEKKKTKEMEEKAKGMAEDKNKSR